MPMRVLILGGGGMLGHKLWQAYRQRFDTWVTVRAGYRQYARYNLFDPARLLEGIDAANFDSIVRAVAEVKPQAVVNCIGIIKQLREAKAPLVSLSINSLLPHRLANLCRAASARLIHISTDCVFSGRKGNYTEDDVSDAEDLYGRTKFLGEVDAPGCLTVRTSIIGRELGTSSGLLDWFFGNRGGKVRGYTRGIYSGFTTLALARILADLLEQQPALSGVYQVSSAPISKFALLSLVNEIFGLEICIEPESEFFCDRSLDSSRFRTATGFRPPDWPAMIREMHSDPTPYDDWRTK
jgi:dTDP-4-dehydrorhamnose reductase